MCRVRAGGQWREQRRACVMGSATHMFLWLEPRERSQVGMVGNKSRAEIAGSELSTGCRGDRGDARGLPSSGTFRGRPRNPSPWNRKTSSRPPLIPVQSHSEEDPAFCTQPGSCCLSLARRRGVHCGLSPSPGGLVPGHGTFCHFQPFSGSETLAYQHWCLGVTVALVWCCWPEQGPCVALALGAVAAVLVGSGSVYVGPAKPAQKPSARETVLSSA